MTEDLLIIADRRVKADAYNAQFAAAEIDFSQFRQASPESLAAQRALYQDAVDRFLWLPHWFAKLPDDIQ